MKRVFVEFHPATAALRAAGVPDEALRQVQLAILRGQGETILGTAGLKKIRCAAAGRGKSGGVRIIFADYPDVGCTLLLFAYPKNVQANLTAGQRTELKALKQALDDDMKKRGRL